MMQPLVYCTVSETPSSPSPLIGPAPTSAQPKVVEASLTGKEPPSVCWTALVMCGCGCGCGCGWVWVELCVCVRARSCVWVCVRSCGWVGACACGLCVCWCDN